MTVHWIIDTRLERTDPMGNRVNESGYNELLHALERTQSPYTLVKTIPFVGTLIGADNEPMRLDIDGPVFVSGCTNLRHTAKEHRWYPGYIDAPGQEELIAAWGDHVLNAEAVIGEFATVAPPSDEFFARPVEDSKSFAGTIFTADEWLDWRDRVAGIDSSESSIKPNDRVILAPLKTIYNEYRLYVVDGQIVTGSRYRSGGKVFYTRDLDPAMIDYAKERLREYCPRDVLCLDIAHIEGDDPYKVIETNAISSSGFYACDMNAFVGAINMRFG